MRMLGFFHISVWLIVSFVHCSLLGTRTIICYFPITLSLLCTYSLPRTVTGTLLGGCSWESISRQDKDLHPLCLFP